MAKHESKLLEVRTLHAGHVEDGIERPCKLMLVQVSLRLSFPGNGAREERNSDFAVHVRAV